MEQNVETPEKGLTAVRLALIGWALMFVAYTLLFWLIGFSDFFEALQRATFNTLPAMLIAWPVVRLVEHYLIEASTTRLILGHFGLAMSYAILWYIGLQVGYGLQYGLPENGIVGRALSGAALTWQLFQGVTLYAVVALYAYATYYKRRLDQVEAVPGGAPSAIEPMTRQIFLKDGRTLRPTALEDILLLSGAGDYTEVSTKDGTYLSSTSLNAFETELPAPAFLRIHRSHIVCTDAVLSVESGGNGRLVLHLPKGVSVTTSRAGAQAVRDLAL